MANGAFVQSMKTITESLVRKAGFDKTRSGKIVGVNALTNTYSVKIDGHVYNNVRVVNDAIYNVGDTVRINIPVNQASQLYISASIYSDASIGKKIGHAESLIDAIEGQLEDVKEIDGSIYQLDITSAYSSNQSTHTGHIYKDGEDVTSATYWSKFKWYLMTSAGQEAQTTGVSDATLTMPIASYKYGMVLILEWVDANNEVLLHKQIVLIDNAELTTKINTVENTATAAKTLAENTNNYFWNVIEGNTAGTYLTRIPQTQFIAATTDAQRGYNLFATSQGISLRYGLHDCALFLNDGTYYNAYVNNQWQQVAAYTTTYAQIGATASGVYNVFVNNGNTPANNGMYVRNGTIDLAKYTGDGMTIFKGTASNNYELAKFDINGMLLRNSSGYKTMENSSNGFILYDGTLNEYQLAKFDDTGMLLKNDDGYVTAFMGNSGLFLYDGTIDENLLMQADIYGLALYGVYSEDDPGSALPIADFSPSGVQLGRFDKSHLELDYHSLSMIDSDLQTYFNVRDLRNEDGVLEMTQSFTGDGNNRYFIINQSSLVEINDIVKVKVDGASVTNWSATPFEALYWIVTFDSAPPVNSDIEIFYTSNSTALKSYTMGVRKTSYISNPEDFGYMSFAEGWHNLAQGECSHAEGEYTTAKLSASHAEGYDTIAWGRGAHAEGYSTQALDDFSHAEGYSTITREWASHAEGWYSLAQGACSHAEGEYTVAKGSGSHTSGNYTCASGDGQTVIGKYNVEDASAYSKTTDTQISSYKTYYVLNNGVFDKVTQPVVGDISNYYEYHSENAKLAFIIGNGSNASNRSNALTVDWNGAITTYQPFATISGTSATTDGTFAETSVTLAASSSIGAGDGSGSIDVTASLTNYYPLAISGWNGDNRHCMLSDCDISARSVGSATVHGYITNTSDNTSIPQSSAKVVVHILWVKAN